MSTARDPDVESGCTALTSLELGVSARLCDHPEVEVSQRLLDLGFVPRTPITVVRRAPLGDPIEIELRGYRLCLRRADVAALCVRAETDSR